MDSHTVEETLIFPIFSDIVKNVVGCKAEKKKIPVLDSTISRQIHDMSADIIGTVCTSVEESVLRPAGDGDNRAVRKVEHVSKSSK